MTDHAFLVSRDERAQRARGMSDGLNWAKKNSSSPNQRGEERVILSNSTGAIFPGEVVVPPLGGVISCVDPGARTHNFPRSTVISLGNKFQIAKSIQCEVR